MEFINLSGVSKVVSLSWCIFNDSLKDIRLF